MTVVAPSAPFAVPDGSPDATRYAAVLLGGMAAIREQQLRTGEIPTYRRTPRGSLEYCRSLFVSSFVHDALGHFDPRSPWYAPQTLDALAAPYRVWLMREAATIRRRIRSFLAWQAENDGTWRFFGRSGGIDPDSDTTACVAASLLEGIDGRPAGRSTATGRWERHVAALWRFRAAEGLYFSYVHPDGTGYTWMDERGRPLLGFDRVVNTNVLRYLALVGEEADEVVAFVLREALEGQYDRGSPDYPNPLCFCYMLARAWRQAHLPDLERIAQRLTPIILARQTEDGGFGGPLSTALAMMTLHDLGYTGPALQRGRVGLLRQLEPWGGWGYEDFVVHGFGSTAWTTALALVALDRCGNFD